MRYEITVVKMGETLEFTQMPWYKNRISRIP